MDRQIPAGDANEVVAKLITANQGSRMNTEERRGAVMGVYGWLLGALGEDRMRHELERMRVSYEHSPNESLELAIRFLEEDLQ